jgi:starch synthase
MSVNIKFDEGLAHQIYAASDFFLIPSRFEPCGLTQLIAMKYGTLPIARKTGGLADTVIDVRQNPFEGTGIVFNNYSAKEFSQAIGRSIGLFNSAEDMSKAIKIAMSKDYSWTQSAKRCYQLYQQLSQ